MSLASEDHAADDVKRWLKVSPRRLIIRSSRIGIPPERRNECPEKRNCPTASLRVALRTSPSRRLASSQPTSRRKESPPSSGRCLKFPATGIPEFHARIKLLRSLFIPELANSLHKFFLRAVAVGKLRGGALDSPLPLDGHQLLRLPPPLGSLLPPSSLECPGHLPLRPLKRFGVVMSNGIKVSRFLPQGGIKLISEVARTCGFQVRGSSRRVREPQTRTTRVCATLA